LSAIGILILAVAGEGAADSASVVSVPAIHSPITVDTPDTLDMFVVYASLRAPTGSHRKWIVHELAREGIQVDSVADDLLAMSLDRARIRTLFQTRVEMRTVVASSRPGLVRVPQLARPVVPKRWRGAIGRVFLDSQL